MKSLYIILLFALCAQLDLGAQQKIDKLNSNYKEILEAPQSDKPEYDYVITPSDRLVAFEYSKLLQDGKVTWVTRKQPFNADKDIVEQQNLWLEDISNLLGLGDQCSFRLLDVWEDDLGQNHYKYDQLMSGIKVFDGEVILHAKDGSLFKHNGQLAKEDLFPSSRHILVSEEKAKEVIENDLPSFKKDWEEKAALFSKDVKRWVGELVWFEDEQGYRLAYNYKVYETIQKRYEYIVDAHSGEILDSWAMHCGLCSKEGGHTSCSHSHGEAGSMDDTYEVLPPDGPAIANARDLYGINRTINTYEIGNNFVLIDASRPMYNAQSSSLPGQPVGALWTVDMNNTTDSYRQVVSSNNSFSNSPEGVSAHYNAGLSYEYFRTTHSRNGLSGDGQTIQSWVNVVEQPGVSYGGAYYNQFGLFYGNGDASFFPLGRGLDVAGHELSHGVVQNSANLVYQDEPGAINESFADIFGAMIDREDWLIGEDVVKTSAYPSGALRSLIDPHNGRPRGDYSRGWQPKHVNEKFTGTQDYGGVHINSGIPNHAYYLFATQVGKDLAERVFYRALTTYMIRSSGFSELRYAVEQSCSDLSNQTTLNAARQAFDQVGITSSVQTEEPDDIDINEGGEFLLVSDLEQSNLYLFDLVTGSIVFNPLSTTDISSKPSVTDSGRSIVFVGADGHIHLIAMDYNSSPPGMEERILTTNPVWRNCAISKDASKIAAVDETGNNSLWVFDLDDGQQNEFTLFNPTYTDGVNTGAVDFADVLEFDFTSNYVMYDASNTISSVLSGETVSFWDIGFINVWNPAQTTFADGDIQKLFSRLPDDVSIGNPTFSKNTPHIIAFDVIGVDDNAIIGMNIETNEQALIVENQGLGYPHYSRTDGVMIYDRITSNSEDLGNLLMEADKITGDPGSAQVLLEQAKWGVWITAGERELPSSVDDLGEEAIMTISPNPASTNISVRIDENYGEARLVITDANGKRVHEESITGQGTYSISVSELASGLYYCTLEATDNQKVVKFIKE